MGGRPGQCGGYDEDVARCRDLYAALVQVPAGWVAVGSQVSAMVSLVAAALPDDAEVLAVEGDFTSVLFPFLVHRDRGVRVRTVPLDGLGRRGRTGDDAGGVLAGAVSRRPGRRCCCGA